MQLHVPMFAFSRTLSLVSPKIEKIFKNRKRIYIYILLILSNKIGNAGEALTQAIHHAGEDGVQVWPVRGKKFQLLSYSRFVLLPKSVQLRTAS
jgi:hypothetical protein